MGLQESLIVTSTDLEGPKETKPRTKVSIDEDQLK